jgi:hypothetical protein
VKRSWCGCVSATTVSTTPEATRHGYSTEILQQGQTGVFPPGRESTVTCGDRRGWTCCLLTGSSGPTYARSCAAPSAQGAPWATIRRAVRDRHAGSQVGGDEIAPEADGGGLGLGMRAGVAEQLFVPRSEQVEDGQLAVPGEDFIVPLDVEQGRGSDTRASLAVRSGAARPSCRAGQGPSIATAASRAWEANHRPRRSNRRERGGRPFCPYRPSPLLYPLSAGDSHGA